MKRGHVVGAKRERTGANDWYKQIEAANLARIDEDYALAGQRNLTAAEWLAQDTTDDDGEYDDGDLVPWDRAA